MSKISSQSTSHRKRAEKAQMTSTAAAQKSGFTNFVRFELQK